MNGVIGVNGVIGANGVNGGIGLIGVVLERGMAELTNQTTTSLYEPKFCSKMCDMKSVTLGFI